MSLSDRDFKMMTFIPDKWNPRTLVAHLPKSQKKPGHLWETKNGKWGSVNKEGRTKYFKDKEEAKEWRKK